MHFEIGLRQATFPPASGPFLRVSQHAPLGMASGGCTKARERVLVMTTQAAVSIIEVGFVMYLEGDQAGAPFPFRRGLSP